MMRAGAQRPSCQDWHARDVTPSQQGPTMPILAWGRLAPALIISSNYARLGVAVAALRTAGPLGNFGDLRAQILRRPRHFLGEIARSLQLSLPPLELGARYPQP